MPISTPNRVADPVMLERYEPPCVLKQTGELSVNYHNTTGNTILQGEPVRLGGRIGIAQSAILPGQQGAVIMDWVVEAAIGGTLGADILQDDTVWWSYDVTSVATSAVGGAVRAAPTNGFILGTALAPPSKTSTLNGSSKAIAAASGSAFPTRVRVMCNSVASPAIGTIPTFS